MTPSRSDDARSEPTHLTLFTGDERRSAARRLGVTEDQLRKAVRLVGSRLSSVRAYLGRSA